MILVIALIIAIIIGIISALSGGDGKSTGGYITNSPSFVGTQGCQPYAKVYGNNREKGPCAVTVTASPEMAVVAIVRYNNIDGDVAGHLFIERGTSGTICLPVGRFQVFFYSGRDWNPEKEMDCGLSGGFTKDEMFQEDPYSKTYSEGTHWSYALRLVTNGNFAPASTDKDLFF